MLVATDQIYKGENYVQNHHKDRRHDVQYVRSPYQRCHTLKAVSKLDKVITQKGRDRHHQQ